jgi:hypothetical protein
MASDKFPQAILPIPSGNYIMFADNYPFPAVCDQFPTRKSSLLTGNELFLARNESFLIRNFTLYIDFEWLKSENCLTGDIFFSVRGIREKKKEFLIERSFDYICVICKELGRKIIYRC